MFHCTCSMGYSERMFQRCYAPMNAIFVLRLFSLVCLCFIVGGGRDIHLQWDAHRYSSPTQTPSFLEGFDSCLIRQTQHFQEGINTVGGRNPAPVDVVNIPLFTVQGFIHPKWCRIFSINSMAHVSNRNFKHFKITQIANC